MNGNNPAEAGRKSGDFELRQMVGYRKSRGRAVKAPTAVDEVLHLGVRIGYIGRHSNAPFTPIVRGLNHELVADCLANITAIRAREGLRDSQLVSRGQPPAITGEEIAQIERAIRRAARGDDDDDEEPAEVEGDEIQLADGE